MVAVDTNVLVRLIVRDDVTQTRSAERFVENGCWASVLALVEATWVLKSTYGFDRSQIVAAIEMLIDNEKLAVENEEAVFLALELFRARPSLGFADCLMLELARKTGHLPLGTFDRALAKVDGAIRL